ncbi:tRNA lysidine(34) synthetase TilS [Sinorhizobium sp. RAC02]|uniref:tRNA lysidine(34) synthetase TilS n=1 Tax=Sinorhizobium sp. RAC02 TaxID=1842534 RepID=UPI00085550AA|nr:tRNA lysidine(34) synthetase TilS [Sinorhizobium sp. RAC02]AOF89452.1 tRNA(Ile)-lysidine synthetase [Sinorhizobium sp. RAC02]
MARAENPVVEATGHFLRSFKSPALLLVAISGGSDSTGLLVALATLCATGRYPDIILAACTIDHALRAGSTDEARWVEALCARHGIPHVTRRWEGEKPASGLQAAARAKRYDLLVEAAAELGADCILAAHTSDDQNETVAMRAERSGEGIGLSGMADAVLLNGAVWLFRPFLSLDRATVRAFLSARGETWLDDPSNRNPHFERVRIRQREAATDPMRPSDGRHHLSERAAAFLIGNVRAENGLFAINPAAVGLLLGDPAAWRGLLLLAATAGGRVHTLETASADRLHAFLASGRLSRLTAGGVVFDHRRAGLFLYRERRGIETLALPAGTAALWDGRYRVANATGRTILVAAAGDEAVQGDTVLRGPALRARRAMPHLEFEDGAIVPEHDVRLEPSIAPYARFLPGFDLPLASALARIVGGRPFSSPPNE